MAGHNIIVIGASAGGVKALKDLVRSFPPDLPAAIFVVLHLAPNKKSHLPQILSRSGPLVAAHPEDPELIRQGHIYVAPPDHHLMVLNGHVGAVLGPKEGRHRPAVDALFRSAAQIYGNRVVGVVLTGALGDGTVGLQAVKENGGITIVQDPNDAHSPGMPASALKYVNVDYCVPLSNMAELLEQLARDPVDENLPRQSSEINMATIVTDSERNTPSGLTCPACKAVLFQSIHDRLMEFRCRVGHTYSPDDLLIDQSDSLERTLWSSVNAIEERAALIRLVAQDLRARGENDHARHEEERAKENDCRAQQIRNMLIGDGDWYSAAGA